MGSAHQHGGLLMGARGWVAKNSGVARSTALMNGRGAKNGTRIGTLSPTSAESVSLSLNFSSETAAECIHRVQGCGWGRNRKSPPVQRACRCLQISAPKPPLNRLRRWPGRCGNQIGSRAHRPRGEPDGQGGEEESDGDPWVGVRAGVGGSPGEGGGWGWTR
eukprot:scaffold21920_cov107-Isochrysis_galbana.AAC.2